MRNFILTMIMGALGITSASAHNFGPWSPEKKAVVKHYRDIKIDTSRLVILRGMVREDRTVPIVQDMIRMEKANNRKPIYLILRTSGGYVVHGNDLINAMESIKAPIICIIDQKAYSMGAVISSFCDKVYMHKRASLMFHESWYGKEGYTSQMESFAKFLQRQSVEEDMDLYHKIIFRMKRKGVTPIITFEQYIYMTKVEWWLTPVQAMESGLIDGVLNNLKYEWEDKAKKPKFPFFMFGFDVDGERIKIYCPSNSVERCD